MNELNKPLGQQPEPPKKDEPAARGSQWTAIAALAVGLVAIGLVGWQMTRPDPEPIVVAAQPAADDDAAETASGSSDSEDEALDSELADDASDEGIVEDGEEGLVELKPEGSMAVPKPRPPRAKPQEAGLAHLPDPELSERGAAGIIPKRSADGRRAMDVYAREADTTGNFGVARVVIIVGGMGLSQTTTQQAIQKLPPNVVLAFAPYGNSLNRWMQAARKKGFELLLQLPMEPFGYPQNTPGPRTLVSSVSAEENLVNLHWAMSRITNYVGVMNYQGAKLLAEPAALKPIFDEVAERGLLFVDDNSASGSRSKMAAARSVLPHASAHILIDTKRTRRDIANQLEALAAEAKRTGLAIGIANGFPESINMIAEFAAQVGKLGIEITPVSAVVSDPERDG